MRFLIDCVSLLWHSIRMWARGGTYRHISCLDIDFVLLAKKYVDANRAKLKVLWVNRHNGMVYYPADKIEIKSVDYRKWRRVKC